MVFPFAPNQKHKARRRAVVPSRIFEIGMAEPDSIHYAITDEIERRWLSV
jgi:hypothetical protein